ncbi:MAG: hypothetical protein WCO23_01675 [bacterium]
MKTIKTNNSIKLEEKKSESGCILYGFVLLPQLAKLILPKAQKTIK